MCSTCFGLSLGHPQACQYKHDMPEDGTKMTFLRTAKLQVETCSTHTHTHTHTHIYIYIYIYIYWYNWNQRKFVFQLYRMNQQDALFTFKLFTKLASTCFEQAYCPSSGGKTLYVQQLVYVMPLC